MFDEIKEILFYGPSFALSKVVWDWIMGLCTGIITATPQEFSPAAWEYVTETLYPWALAIGTACVNLFFIINFLKAVSNFKENITLELCIEALIRLVAVNVLLHAGVLIVRAVFTMASLLAGQVLSFNTPDLFTGEMDHGSKLFWLLFGYGYFLVSAVCGVIIFLTLYGRYIKLYLLLLFYPIAMSAVAGGRGIESSAYAWIRTFLSNTLEVVVIALVMSVAGYIIRGVNLPDAGIEGTWDGFAEAMKSLLYMILMASSVKGASALMNKAFNL